MQADIHPRYDLTTITCASAAPSIASARRAATCRVDVCAECHPFYTGVERQAARGGRVARFEARRAAPRPGPRPRA